MSFLTTIQSFWAKDEAWVLNFIQQAKAGVAVVEADFKAFWSWMENHAGQITQDAQMVTSAVNSLRSAGVPVPAAVGVAIAGMNMAVTSLNAAVNAANAGGNSVDIVTAGYVAAKQAEVAHAQAAIAVVQAPVPAKK